MSTQVRQRRRYHQANPFVVLSDITISVILLLLVYFSAMAIDLQRRVVNLSRENAAQLERVQAAQARVAKILDSPELSNYDIEVVSDGNIQVFTFGDGVLFAQGKSDLSPRGAELLRAFGRLLGAKLAKEQPYPEIQVQGHTDTVPADNWTLSTNCALAVVKALIAQGTIKPKYLSAAGYSYHRPRQPVVWKKAQPMNRRVEVRLIYSTGADEASSVKVNPPPWDIH